jgi:heme iron utilization protein
MVNNVPSTPVTKPQPPSPDADALRIVKISLKAALGTLRKATGDPYVSLVTVATEPCGTPLMLISRLAVHTQNLLADPRASLMFDATSPTGDPLAGGRVTVTGRASVVTSPDARRRFLARQPAAEMYADFPDFAFYRLDIESAHYIGGFGRIVDLKSQQLLLNIKDAGSLIEAEADIVDHMNGDHADAVSLYAHVFGAATPVTGGAWRFVGLDPEGFDLVCDGYGVRIPFGSRVTTANGARQEFVRLSAEAKSRLATAPMT